MENESLNPIVINPLYVSAKLATGKGLVVQDTTFKLFCIVILVVVFLYKILLLFLPDSF